MNRPWFDLAQSEEYLQGEAELDDAVEARGKKPAAEVKRSRRSDKDASDSSSEDDDDDGRGMSEPMPWLEIGPPAALASLVWQRIPLNGPKRILSAAHKQSLDSTWNALETAFNRVVSRSNAKLFKELLGYLEDCEQRKQLGTFLGILPSSSGEKIIPQVEEHDDHDEDSQDSEDNHEDASRGDDDDGRSESANRRTKSAVRVHSQRPILGHAISNDNDSDVSSDDDGDDSSDFSEGIDSISENSDSSGARSSTENGGDADNDKGDDENDGESVNDDKDSDINQSSPHLPLSSSSAHSCQFLPTALVIGGQDTVDNEMLLGSLARHLQASSKRRKVVQLSSHQAASAKSIVGCLANLIDTRPGVSAVDRIVRWLTESPPSNSSSSSTQPRSKGKERANTLVVILDDCEFFDVEHLKQLIRALSYVNDKGLEVMASVVLILGISSVAGAQGLHGLLDRDDIRRLAITKFRPDDSVLVYESLFYELFVRNPTQLRFSPKVLSWFHDRFRLDDFSLHAFRKYLKYCVMRHFEQEPFSFLCCAPSRKTSKTPEEWAEATLDKFSDELKQVVRQHFHGGGGGEAEQNGLSGLKRSLVDLERNRRDLPGLFRFVQICGLKLGFLNRNQSLARNALTSALPFMEETRVDLKAACLKASLDVLTDLHAVAETHLPISFRDIISTTWGDGQTTYPLNPPSTAQSTTTLTTTRGEKPKDFYKWGAEKRKRWMMEMTAQSSTSAAAKSESSSSASHRGGRSDDDVRALRLRVMRLLESVLDDHLFKYMGSSSRRLASGGSSDDVDEKQFSLLVSAFRFDRSKVLDSVFSLSQAELLARALMTPGKYLVCECCDPTATKDHKEILSTMDDTVVAFKTLQDVGDVVQTRLRDWYEAFADVLLPSGEEGERPRKTRSRQRTEKTERKVLARFVKAACELQYLGLWKGDAQENAKKLIKL